MNLGYDKWINGSGGFKIFFEEHYSSFCVLANYYLPDSAEGADIVQEAFVSVWNKRADIRDTRAAKAYLYKHIKNRCLNCIRDTKRRQGIIGESHDLSHFNHDKVIEQETYELIYKAIKNLSPQNQQVIEYSLDGLSNKEIAEKLNISINSVKTNKQRAFQKLRKLLIPELFLLIYLSKKYAKTQPVFV
ncbi:MAG: RNA polymerase sigma factor [Mangrovibacterium sp.]